MADGHKPTACLDFDGVLNTYDGWQGQSSLFLPRPGIVGFLELLGDEGFDVLVHSTRQGYRIQKWLEQHGLAHLATAVDDKPPAIAYVDDRGVPFTGDFDEALDRVLALRDEGPFWDS